VPPPPPLARPPPCAAPISVRFLPPPLWLAPSFFRLKCGVEKALFFLLFVMMGAIPFDLQASLSFKKKDRFFCSVRFDVIWLAVRVPLELGSRAAGWAIAFGASFFAAL